MSSKVMLTMWAIRFRSQKAHKIGLLTVNRCELEFELEFANTQARIQTCHCDLPLWKNAVPKSDQVADFGV
jgi:hypothetical protein